MPSLTPEQKDEVCRLYPESRGLKDLAKRFGVSTRTIVKALEAGGVPRKRRGRATGYCPRPSRFTDKHVRYMAELYADGHTLREIGDIVGCSYELVRRFLESASVERRAAGKMTTYWSPDDLEEAKALYREGKSLSDLAIKYGIHERTAARRLKDAGVEVRTGPATPSDKDEAAAELYRQGLSVAKVSAALDLGRGAVEGALRREKVKTRSQPEATSAASLRYSEAQVDEMERLYVEEWLSLEKVAGRIGCSAGAVKYRLRKRGIRIRTTVETRNPQCGSRVAATESQGDSRVAATEAETAGQ